MSEHNLAMFYILVNINCYDASSVEILSHIDSISSKSWKKTIEIVDAKKDMIWMVGLKLADNIQAGKDYFTEDDYSFLCQKN